VIFDIDLELLETAAFCQQNLATYQLCEFCIKRSYICYACVPWRASLQTQVDLWRYSKIFTDPWSIQQHVLFWGSSAQLIINN